MKNFMILLYALFVCTCVFPQQLLKGKESSLSFFSTTPLENISAKNKYVALVIKTTTGDIQIQAPNTGFTFERPLMQEHFNENYMESEKYPSSSFSGKIVEPLDYSKDGVKSVTAKGKLTVHGVTKEVEIKGTITVASGKTTLEAKFPVKVADYGIKVPTLVSQKIAEVVEVTLISVLEPIDPKKK